MADSERSDVVFSGFDSAWGARNSGAICNLVLTADGSLRLARDPVIANWDFAIDQASQARAGEVHVWAIDQPVCVQNAAESRPVERDIARALMADFGCGAHSSNLGNPCWKSGARIWDFIRALEENGYIHSPMAVPGAKNGRYYFECYPHLALLGLFDLAQIVKYKIRHKNTTEWHKVIDLLRTLAQGEFPVVNIRSVVREDLARNKANEDKLDAIVSAYTAAFWWKFGTGRSTMIGDLTTGYIVTPHSYRTFAALAEVFGDRLNQRGRAGGVHHSVTPAVQANTAMPQAGSLSWNISGDRGLPVEPSEGWSEPAELTATDTSNIWRTSRSTVINSWMDTQRMTGWRLWVRFIDEDGQPTVLFVPFGNQGSQQCGMKVAPTTRRLWGFMVADAARTNPSRFPVRYRYEEIC